MALNPELDLRGLLLCARAIDANRAILTELERRGRGNANPALLLRAVLSDLDEVFEAESTSAERAIVNVRRLLEGDELGASLARIGSDVAPKPKAPARKASRKKPG